MRLGLNASDVQAMTEQLRHGLVAHTPAVQLEGEVEIDEVYVVAGHKGQPAAVAKGGGSGAVASWQARRDAARWRRTSREFVARIGPLACRGGWRRRTTPPMTLDPPMPFKANAARRHRIPKQRRRVTN